LMSLNPTNSNTWEYSSTNLLPQKVTPLIPVPTNTTFNFLSPNPNPQAGKINPAAANMLTDDKNFRLDCSIIMLFYILILLFNVSLVACTQTPAFPVFGQQYRVKFLSTT